MFFVVFSEPSFPAITVCNTDPLSDLGYDSNSSSFDQFNEYWDIAYEVPEIINGRFDFSFYNRANSPKGIFENVDRSQLYQLGHELDQFVIFCAYRGIECDYTNDFILFQDPYYFNCYTYHIPDDISDVDTGPAKGVTFVFFLEANPFNSSKDEYLTRDDFIEQTAGVKIELHEKGMLPNPTVSGIDVLPGHSTSIALKQSEMHFKGDPYTLCTNQEFLSDLKAYRYSRQRCFDVCKSKYVFDSCGCVNPESPIPDSLRDINATYCGTYNDSTGNLTESMDQLLANLRCEKQARISFTSGVCDGKQFDKCFEACHYDKYDVSVTSLRWPSVPALFDTLYDFVRGWHWKARATLDHDIYEYDHEAFRDVMWNNLARVNIYFNEPKVTMVKEMPSITIYDLFANIGGTVGLWTGLSIITLVEFVTLSFQIFHFYFKRIMIRR